MINYTVYLKIHQKEGNKGHTESPVLTGEYAKYNDAPTILWSYIDDPVMLVR